MNTWQQHFLQNGKSVFGTIVLNRQTPTLLMEMHQENVGTPGIKSTQLPIVSGLLPKWT